jgi:hypothetical protein
MKIINYYICLIISSFLCEIYTKNFRYYTYDEIWDIFTKLATTCTYIKIDSSQNRYNLPSGGDCSGKPCKNLIVFMTDFESMSVDRPQIYISGLLHGDEVIGATTLTELALYFCESKNKDPWVNEIMKSRYFVFTPFTNSYGFANGLRNDFILKNDNTNSTADPNKDFPYFSLDSETTDLCMQTISARTVNEIFREHLFIKALSFRAGLNTIGFPWGNLIHRNFQSSTHCPDCSAAIKISMLLQRYSSSYVNQQLGIADYSISDITQTVIY